jgi:hypothetical protein
MRAESRHSNYKKAICTSTSNFSSLPEIFYFVPGFEKLFPSVAIPKTKIRLLHLGDVILEKSIFIHKLCILQFISSLIILNF